MSRILVVDDEKSNLIILSAILNDDYSVTTATSGEQAMEIAAQETPDLVLLDVMMPGMDGIEVCSKMNADDTLANIPIIFVTTLDDPGDEGVGFAAGACDYIHKPVSPAIVLARVKIHLQNRNYEEFRELLLSEKIQQLEDVVAQSQILRENIV